MATRTAPRAPIDSDETTKSVKSADTAESLPTLAEVLDRVASHGPQIITRGDDRFVVQSAQEFDAATSTQKKRKYKDFKDVLFNGPRFDGVDIEREPWTMRDIDL